MVFREQFILLGEQLWQASVYINDSIILKPDMDGKYADRFDRSDERNHFGQCIVESGPKARTRYKRIQSTCYNFLERPSGVLSVSYHFALFGLVVVGLVFAILETMDELKDNADLLLGTYILEVFLLIVFTSEYILRMWSAGCRSTYSGILGRIRFAFKPFVIVDIIVIASTFGVIIYSSNAKLSTKISILRFVQVLRMVRFDRQGGSWKLLGSVLFLHRQELLTTFYIGFCSLIFASFFVFQAESADNSEEFGTFADSFWWGVVTLTTVGYGDKVPKSWAGRGVAAFFAIMGISFFALPAGILGSGFALKVSQHQRQKHVKRRRRPAAMLIQCNWRYYASQKNSKLHATWSPYIKYLQEKNSMANHVTEKPSQPMGLVRKISIFGRKSSGLSSDGMAKPGSTTPEQAKRRGRKARSELFNSIDSLQDGQSTAAEQHTDDEHGGSLLRQKPILITDANGHVSLPSSYKRSIRFTRYLKFLVALRKFKLAKKPYDVKDVIEQYSTGHVEVLGKVKSIGQKIDEALGYKVGTEKINENPPGRTNIVHRLSKLEKQVKSLEGKLDLVINLLEDSKKKEVTVVTVCDTEQGEDSNETKKSVRKRKLGVSNQNLNMDSFCERDESGEENVEHNKYAQDNDYGLKVDGAANFLSPSYGCLDVSCDGALSRHSSAYGISDNCPSPNPSSSDESYHSKDMFDDDTHPQQLLVPGDDSVYCDHLSDGTLYGSHPPDRVLFSDPEQICKFISPDYPDASVHTPTNYGTTNPGYLTTNNAHDFMLPGHDSSDLSTMIVPPECGNNGDFQLKDDGISGYQAKRSSDLVTDNLSQNVDLNQPLSKHEIYVEDNLQQSKCSSPSQVQQDRCDPKKFDENYLSPKTCDSFDLQRPRADSAFFSVDSENKKPGDHSAEISPESSDTEVILSNRSKADRSLDMAMYNSNGVQETTM